MKSWIIPVVAVLAYCSTGLSAQGQGCANPQAQAIAAIQGQRPHDAIEVLLRCRRDTFKATELYLLV
jgi:hypothetical protein